MNKKKLIELVVNSVVFIILGWFIYCSFNELFIYEEGVHYPRIALNNSMIGGIYFSFNTPTVVNIIILLSALISVCISAAIFIIHIFSIKRRTRICWLIIAIGITICLHAYIIGVIDFFSSAFQGVG